MEAVQNIPALSQGERVIDTFIAPSKTFTDIFRSTSWWLPIVLLMLVSLGSSYTVDKKIGFDAVAEHNMSKNKSAEEQMAQLPPADRAKRMHISAIVTRVISYGFIVPVLIIVAVEALVLLACFNFILGAKVTFSQTFAVLMYANLPKLFVGLLTIVLLFAGVSTDGFDQQNPVGSNVGYYLADSSAALKAAGSFFDVFGLWSLALLVLGMAIISRKSIGQSAAIIVGWWFVFLLIATGVAAATS